MIGSARSTQPPSPIVAVASRPSRPCVPGSILKADTRRPASTPSRWKRGMILASANRNVKCGSWYRGSMGGPPSAPDPLDLVAQLLQLRDDALLLVALNLDAPVLDRPTRAAALLEHGGEFPHAVVTERQVEHGRHAPATPARPLPAH